MRPKVTKFNLRILTMRTVLMVGVLASLLSGLAWAQSPVPYINNPLVPDVTTPGGADFTLTVRGTGFVPSTVVNWNGSALATQFVNSSQLTATVPAPDIATPGTATVTAVTLAPGGGSSNFALFSVTPDAGTTLAFNPLFSPPLCMPRTNRLG